MDSIGGIPILASAEIEVLFTRECELRFDFIEDVGASHHAVNNGVEVAQGTWVTVDEAFPLWGA